MDATIRGGQRDNITYVGSKLFQSGFSESIYVIQRIKELFGNKIVTIGGGPQVDYFWDLFDSEGLFYENKKGSRESPVDLDGRLLRAKVSARIANRVYPCVIAIWDRRRAWTTLIFCARNASRAGYGARGETVMSWSLPPQMTGPNRA